MIARDAVERRLEHASAMVEIVLGGVSRPGVVEAARRRRTVLALIETSAYPTAKFGRSRELELANPAWRSLFGDEALDPQLVPYVDAVLRSCESVHVPELMFSPDSHLMYCAATARAARGNLGATVGAIVICEVITDEVVARKLGVDPSLLIWSGQVGADADYFNAAWRAVAGPLPWRELVHPSDLGRCLRQLGQVSLTHQTVECEVRILCGTQLRWHRILVAVDGARWFLAAHDIHLDRTSSLEREELLASALAAREDAELANRRKDQFLAAVSHELRTPVTTMMLWDKVLRDETSDTTLRAQALDTIHESAAAQARLVGDLLDISRAISGKLHVDVRAIDIHQVVAEALAGIASVAAARGILIDAPSGAVALVQGDAFRVRQILDNLLSNALKFTDRGRISVAITSNARSITVVVTDSGRGIAAERLQQIFEPFSQFEDGLRSGGLGLGLAISKQLVDLQHGVLTAASPGIGLGSTFTLTLPAAGQATSPTVVPNAPKLAPCLLVLVDDDPRVLHALSLLLERAGARVLTAESAEAGRRAIAASAPQLLLCDLAMPGEDGYTLITKLRASGVRIPSIALTAHAMKADAERALAAGFDAHVAKPIDFEQLVAMIARMIGARKSGNQIT